MTAQFCGISGYTIYLSSNSSSFGTGSSRTIAKGHQCGGSGYIYVGGVDANGNNSGGQFITNETAINNVGISQIVWHLICYPSLNSSLNVSVSTYNGAPMYTFSDCDTGPSYSYP